MYCNHWIVFPTFSRFMIFSLLLPFVHREGGIGQQARDALLLCMALSASHTSVGQYIAQHSNFCPVSSSTFVLCTTGKDICYYLYLLTIVNMQF